MEKLDLLVLGATGFTGNSTVKFLTELSEEPEYQNVTWGIAGRSEKKLQILLKELSELKIKTSSVVIIKCDINNETDLRNATGRTKILINCTGPHSILGESVIKSCIETRTHYVDISAELPVSGSDPGYYTTAMCLIISAMTILRESDKMPKGGVLMPAAAFQNTNLVENLMKHKMEFEVVTK